MRARGYVWSAYCKNYVQPEPSELLSASELPFNLAGEVIEQAPSAEGEARAKADREYVQERAQRSLFECGGTFDGFSCGSDADSGL
jgi:hypothetical protein